MNEKNFKVETITKKYGINNFYETMRYLKRRTDDLQFECSNGIMTIADVAKEMKMIKNKELIAKKRLVESIHVKKNGELRSIKAHGTKNILRTKMPDGSFLYGVNNEVIYDKILEYYNVTIHSTKLSDIFEDALSAKEREENPSSETIRCYRYYYKKYISDKLGKMDINDITVDILKEETTQLIKKMNSSQNKKFTKKSFLKYKNVLNLIFDYAYRKNIISINPVVQINNKPYYKNCDTSKPNSSEKIFSEEEIDLIRNKVRERMTDKHYHGYFINGYAILIAIETGMRVGELCALNWSDIKEDSIHIHRQQICNVVNHAKKYSIVGYTKNERGVSEDGRYFPITFRIRSLLNELKELQDRLGIKSDYVFCDTDGNFIIKDSYINCLRRICESLKLNLTNNHAFRMALNSNILIPRGCSFTTRAMILGHSPETNLKYYTYSKKDYLKEASAVLNARSQQGHNKN